MAPFTSTPTGSSSAPIIPTPDPIDPTPAPIESTLVPVLPTPDPVVPTPAPVDQCQSITEVVCTLPEFEVLCALVGDADLADVLGSNDKFTLFAPINTAFESLSQEILDAIAGDVEFLKNVLLSHAVADEELFSTDLICDDKVAMANGVETTTICTGDKLFQVGGGNTPDIIPEIVAPDGVACNGVIHAIDHVIFP
ncbi:FAS1 domain-containing protein, partial [Fragilariopsis cylindrus CCMP1102]